MARGHDELGIKGRRHGDGTLRAGGNIPEGRLCRPSVAKVMRDPAIAARMEQLDGLVASRL
jgi:hypothetical protein